MTADDPERRRPDGPSLDDVLERAAAFQEVVPGAVLVGGTAAAFHARHRVSVDHDHVVADLAQRFDTVLEHLESLGEWTTAKVAPGKVILGAFQGIETGVRQMLRVRPLETEPVEIDGRHLVVPTVEEMLRIKAWLAVQRNQTRDYVDLAALSDRLGTAAAAQVLAGIDDYYAEVNRRPEAVAVQVARQLADPRPRDADQTDRLADYKQLADRWHEWEAVRAQTAAVAAAMIGVTDAGD